MVEVRLDPRAGRTDTVAGPPARALGREEGVDTGTWLPPLPPREGMAGLPLHPALRRSLLVAITRLLFLGLHLERLD